jgi:hypothetical protein
VPILLAELMHRHQATKSSVLGRKLTQPKIISSVVLRKPNNANFFHATEPSVNGPPLELGGVISDIVRKKERAAEHNFTPRPRQSNFG